MQFKIKKLLLIIAMLGITILPVYLNANTDSPLEAKIKAAYIYNFTHFVEWPSLSAKKKKICVLGEEHVAALLEELILKRAEADKYEVTSSAEAPLNDCHLLFIGRAVDDDISAILDEVKMYPVLTVSDAAAFVSEGGMIGLFNKRGKIHFEINIERAGSANLYISSKLLNLATVVR